MAYLTIFAIAHLFFGAFMFLLMCVNPNASGLLGIIHRFFFKTIAGQIIRKAIRIMFGQSGVMIVQKIKGYFDEGNHPIFQLLYILMTVGGYISYAIVSSKILLNDRTSVIHIILFHVLAFVGFWCYYQACISSPGSITLQNVDQQIEKYKAYYDGLIFKKDNSCTTCLLIKPARSKHCSICKICVAKCDHHCTWIRKCVGQNNYKEFLMFLFANVVWVTESTIVGAVKIAQYLYYDAQYTRPFLVGPDSVDSIFQLSIFKAFIINETLFSFLLMLGITGTIALNVVLMVHLWLISSDLTTNQRIKKNQFIAYFQQQMEITQILKTKFVDNVQQIKFKQKIMTKMEVYDYYDQCKRRRANLQIKRDKSSLLKKIYSLLRK